MSTVTDAEVAEAAKAFAAHASEHADGVLGGASLAESMRAALEAAAAARPVPQADHLGAALRSIMAICERGGPRDIWDIAHAALTRTELPPTSPAHAALRPVPQVGEVAAAVPPDVVQRWRAQMSRPHVIIRDMQQLGTEMADMIAAQAAALAAKDAEMERLRLANNKCETEFRQYISEKGAARGALDRVLVAKDTKIAILQARAQDLEAAIKAFQRDRGRHEGQHDFTRSGTPCRLCEEAYVKAEAVLDAVLAPAGKEMKP